jgi:hypothetical protein
MYNETWIVHCLHTGTGSSLVGIATSLKNANALYKDMCRKMTFDDYFDPETFVKTVKKAKGSNAIVLDLT